MASNGTITPGLEIRMVRENLALAIAYWTAVKKGMVTPDHLPTGRAVVTSDAGEVVEIFNPLELKGQDDLLRCAANQVRGSFAFSVMQAHSSLEAGSGSTPLQEADSDFRSARCAIHLLNNSLQRVMLTPVWVCPPSYRHSFNVEPVAFTLDATHLEGKPVVWDDFGGLEKYLGLLEFCADWVEEHPYLAQSTPVSRPERPATPRLGLVEALTQDDQVAQFIAEVCSVGSESQTIAGELYSEYLDWCRETGQTALVQRSFGMRLTQLGFTRRRRGRGRHWWQGIALAASRR